MVFTLLTLSRPKCHPCPKQTLPSECDSPATGLASPALSVRHDLITSILLDARCVILDLPTVCAVAQKPMQLQAHAHVSRLPPACLLQVQVSKAKRIFTRVRRRLKNFVSIKTT